jgi:hypothetical protein
MYVSVLGIGVLCHHVPSSTFTHARTHARPRARARTHTHTQTHTRQKRPALVLLVQAMAELVEDGERVLIIKTIFHSEQTIHVPCEFQLKF